MKNYNKLKFCILFGPETSFLGTDPWHYSWADAELWSWSDRTQTTSRFGQGRVGRLYSVGLVSWDKFAGTEPFTYCLRPICSTKQSPGVGQRPQGLQSKIYTIRPCKVCRPLIYSEEIYGLTKEGKTSQPWKWTCIQFNDGERYLSIAKF